MCKLSFYYGTMGCSKSANALMTRWQYIDKGKQVLLIKPEIDTRSDIKNSDGTITTIIESRAGISAEALVVKATDNLKQIILNDEICYDVIICDEAQFLTEKQIEQLKDMSEYFEILCYGLSTDFKTKLFPGSKRLFELADKIIRLDNVCECGKPALINARLNSQGKILTQGSQVEIGGDDKYKALCWKCFKNKLSKSKRM